MQDLLAPGHGGPGGGPRGGGTAAALALAVGGAAGAGAMWAVSSLHGSARGQIEAALVAGFGLVALVLAVVHFGAGRGSRPARPGRFGQPGLPGPSAQSGRENAPDRERALEFERMRQQTAWTAQLSRILIVAARELAAGGPPEQIPAVEQALAGGDLAAIEAAFSALAAQAAQAAAARPAVAATAAAPQIQAQASMTIARRVLTMVIKVLRQLDALQRETEDPRALRALFAIDEQVTRIRRSIETLAVLGGVAPRSASRPVAVHTLLRQAVAETEDYKRVQILPPVTGLVHGVAAADVIHLVAELVENAAKFSRPDTMVSVRVQEVSAGLAVDIDDRGLGMDPRECERACALLATLDPQQVAQRLNDGQLGFLASAHFAARHGIGVRVEPNIVGGVHALVLLPQSLLSAAPPAAETASNASTAADVAASVTGPAAVTGPVADDAPRAARTNPALTPVSPRGVTVPQLPVRVSQAPAIAAQPAPASPAPRSFPGGWEPEPAPAPAPSRPPLPRREGSYLPQPAAEPEPQPFAGSFSPGLLAGFQSGYQGGAGTWDSGDDADGYELPHRKA